MTNFWKKLSEERLKNIMDNSEFNLKFEGEIRPFPTIRNNYEYIGDIFDENNERHPEYWKIIKLN
jgi:hypothetical protein